VKWSKSWVWAVEKTKSRREQAGGKAKQAGQQAGAVLSWAAGRLPPSPLDLAPRVCERAKCHRSIFYPICARQYKAGNPAHKLNTITPRSVKFLSTTRQALKTTFETWLPATQLALRSSCVSLAPGGIREWLTASSCYHEGRVGVIRQGLARG